MSVAGVAGMLVASGESSPSCLLGYDATRPLEADMVLSIETTMTHPKRGFIKLEDTIAVTEEGCVGFGDQGRDWNRAG
jgi:Xaa-Pro dipeptidase